MRKIICGKEHNPYKKCPVYFTEHFMLRLINSNDSNDLLTCYSDVKAQKFFNSDYCSSDFCYQTIDEMTSCVQMWVDSFDTEQFIRFAIIDLQNEKAVGTMEIFGGNAINNFTGVLRIDISSVYETESFIKELLTISNLYFHTIFPVKHIITKAIPEASERIKALKDSRFDKFEFTGDRPGKNYYIYK